MKDCLSLNGTYVEKNFYTAINYYDKKDYWVVHHHTLY